MDTSVQARLRAVSHASHVRINQHPLLLGLTRPDYPQANYHVVLTAYFHLYSAIEARIGQFSATHPVPFDYMCKVKSQWLIQDLNHLNKIRGGEHYLRGLLIQFPEISGIGQLIGVLYPIEGATLGGRIIAKHLKQNFGLTQERGAAFFNGYAGRTDEYWKRFCEFADVIRDDPEQCACAEEAAIFTFLKFEEVLNEYQQLLDRPDSTGRGDQGL